MVGNGQPGRAATDHGYTFTVTYGLYRLYETFAKGGFYDGHFIFTDSDGFIATKFQYATFFTQGGADAAGKFRKVTGLFQYVEGFFPLSFVEEVLPFGLFVTNGARPVTEGDTAIHAAGSLAAAVTAVECLFYFAEVADTIFYRTVACFLSGYSEECSRICHI